MLTPASAIAGLARIDCDLCSSAARCHCGRAPTVSRVHGIYHTGQKPARETELKFGDLTPEVQAARLLHCRRLGIVSVRRLAAVAGLPVERTELLMCRGLSTLIARGY